VGGSGRVFIAFRGDVLRSFLRPDTGERVVVTERHTILGGAVRWRRIGRAKVGVYQDAPSILGESGDGGDMS
jgi:hypothetical protein